MKHTPLIEERTRYASKAAERKAQLQRVVGLLTEEDMTLLLTVSEHTLQQWRQRKVGPWYIKLEKGVFYRIEDVEAWIDSSLVVTRTVDVVEQFVERLKAVLELIDNVQTEQLIQRLDEILACRIGATGEADTTAIQAHSQ